MDMKKANPVTHNASTSQSNRDLSIWGLNYFIYFICHPNLFYHVWHKGINILKLSILLK